MKKLYIIAIIALSTMSTYSNESGYNINVHVRGMSQSQLILCYYLGGSVYPNDTLLLNSSGRGAFIGNEALPQGVYMIYFENGSNFDIIIGEDQHFTLETDTIDYIQNLNVTGSLENKIFSDFQQYTIRIQSELKSQQDKINDSTTAKEKEKIALAINRLTDERSEKINTIVKKYPDLFVSTFLKATLDIEVPEDISSNRASGYHYYKANYFNNFDLSDVRLLYTPLYNNKIFYYLDKVVVQSPDSLIAAVDMILENSRVDSAYYMHAVSTLFNKYSKNKYMGIDAVLVHIAQEYYLTDAWWIDEKFKTNLEDRVASLKPLLIGKPAPDVQLRYVPDEHFIQAKSDTALKRYPHAGSFFHISHVDADFTILAFWEATCGHCKKDIPKLHQIYQDTLVSMNVKIVSISTLFGEDGKEKWIDFVNKKELYGWINSWNPYDYKYKTTYDIRSAPQLYILNKDKEIIGKKLGVEQIVDFIGMYKQSTHTL